MRALSSFEEGDYELYEPKHTFAEACQWLLEGKKVRRRAWPEAKYWVLEGYDGLDFGLSRERILATDWEFLEPNKEPK